MANPLQQIGALQQGVDVGRRQQQAATLRGDEAVFHHMGHAHAAVQPDDARRALERMGGAHARFQMGSGGRFAFERQQARVQDFRLCVCLEREQFEHRGVAELLRVHDRLRDRACRSRSASSRPTVWPSCSNSARV